jgi:hypothetical protein
VSQLLFVRGIEYNNWLKIMEEKRLGLSDGAGPGRQRARHNNPMKTLSAAAIIAGAICLGSVQISRSASPALSSAIGGQGLSIDVGRQLFIDDYLVAETTLKRSIHQARLYENNPILSPQTAVELNENNGGRLPVATPFDDGAWYDPQDRLFKIWYMGGWFDGVCYVQSKDGLSWERPNLDIVPGSNRVLPIRQVDGHTLERDGTTIWLDNNEKDPAKRYKMSCYARQSGVKGEGKASIYTSADGIHWHQEDIKVGGYGQAIWYGGDNTSFFYDPFRKQWVASIRERVKGVRSIDPKATVRARFIYTNDDFGKLFSERRHQDVQLWLGPDLEDKSDPGITDETQLYDFTAVAYESLMVGVYGVLERPPKDGEPKIIDLKLGFSRDGFHYERPTHDAFIACSRKPGAWDRGYLHPATGVCMVVGDELWFYYGSFSGEAPKVKGGTHMYGGGHTGMARLRRDGFLSLDADGNPGTLTTKPVVFKGKYMFVNVAAPEGELRVEAVDADGKVIAPYSMENCVPVKTDSTHAQVTWKGGEDLSALAGKPVQFRFQLTSGQFYSFWVTADASGASNGYVAAGGPGFTGSIDTVGAGQPNAGRQ